MKIKSFLIAMCGLASLATYGQSSPIGLLWSLDSIKVIELSIDNKERQVNYDELKDSINKYVFDTIDIGTNNKCTIIRGKEKISAEYTFTNELFTIEYNGEKLPYQYNLIRGLYFKGEFSGINLENQKVKYIIQMWFSYANIKY
jgi:hypothetical protein